MAHRSGRNALYLAGGVSSVGTQMTMLALPWLVLESTGSAARTGLVFAVQILPIALLGFLGGTVIQRLGARRTMLVADIARAPIVALVPVLHAADALSLGALLALVALIGVFGVPYAASQRVLAVALTGDDPHALTRANSVLDGIYGVSAFGGPAIAGALIALFGPAQVLWLDAFSFALSALVLLAFVPRVGRSAPARGGPRGVLAGLRHLRADRFLAQTVLSTLMYGFLLRVLAVALPLLAFVSFDGNARLGGLLVAAEGAGALLGSLGVFVVAGRVPAPRLAGVAMIAVALPLWLLPLPLPPAGLVAAVAVSAAAVSVSNAPYMTILGTRVPAELLPKVLQAVMTISNIAGPLGFLCAGLLMQGVGIRASLVVVAACATLATLNFLIALARMDRVGVPPAPQKVFSNA
ncbi:MFS transporter [Micromonospora eburnea]|uniref:Major Facilitator Superfamily protein n=1 Tax=Micromonospora eburnea TaxID=227316 RepID=A0A1C6UVG4_9ACTN|nr:MFS transporter [Micromonospora eburnea]SCL57853.1 Major Facilitator Superfamily protein [Micromonospora eburnea]